ncbi:mutT/nudix-family hydrolase [Mycobacterium intracellulare 1956]|uniref:MutT/nudix-family hydrolase n=1 Tax=Mycobacterium intracellulare 1956 TaxID=1299331 RepID=X8CGZ1_MYCIT|nr:mutT/nudix-family hydrolase [Mycobacterium intracellulare 1956]
MWRRDQVFEFNGSLIDSEEFYFVYRTRRFEPSRTGRTELERSYIHGHRWCDAADIAQLVAAGETVYPMQLSGLLTDAAALAGGRAPARCCRSADSVGQRGPKRLIRLGRQRLKEIKQ